MNEHQELAVLQYLAGAQKYDGGPGARLLYEARQLGLARDNFVSGRIDLTDLGLIRLAVLEHESGTRSRRSAG